jgi:membrane protein DedA with SNARE-associated domain
VGTFFQTLSDQLVAMSGSWLVLLAVVAVATIDGFFPPIPSETVVIAVAAVYSSANELGRAMVLVLAACLGACLGDNTAYWIGRVFKPQRWRLFRQGHGATAYAWAERSFRKTGASLLFAARYVPVGRVAVNLVAGSIHFPWRRFAIFDAAAALTWGLYSTILGYVGGAFTDRQPLLAMVIGMVLGVGLGALVQRLIGSKLRFDAPSSK